MAVLKKIKRAVRGEVNLATIAREVIRRSRVSLQHRKERASLDRNEPLSLLPRFSRMSADELLAHFQGTREARFFDGFREAETVELQRSLFPTETAELIVSANRIVDDHCWPLLGVGEKCFGKEIQWTRDPLSNSVWPLDYHRDIKLIRGDGSDVRVLWELNRLGHFLTLARAYALTDDERYSVGFFTQLRSWTQQNPYGRGANWTCAMEVALRAINLLAAFEIFRHSPQLNSGSLQLLLQLFQQHGSYIQRNLEFSYLATSNHYLSDVVGLLWLGLMLPEFGDAKEWRDFGVAEMLREMDKQVLADGADFEASTGYHRYVLELFLYSFFLCLNNDIEIHKKYWYKLHQMLVYLRSYLRPDGFAPLIGDTDSGQVLPICRRRADDHGYLLAIDAVLFKDSDIKVQAMEPPEELLWLRGKAGITAYLEMRFSPDQGVSKAFPEAGTYIMRDGDLYLCFNASSAGVNGRGSHGHNDALSIEVSAHGKAFIVDPGTYVYSADLQKRHEFRSTAYHSTVKIDDKEQNTINRDTPFVIGDEARPRVLEWKTDKDFDKIVAEHYGYSPVIHRRSITFNKQERYWLMDDEFFGEGEHVYEVRFHFASGLDVSVRGAAVEARSGDVGLIVSSLSSEVVPGVESQPVSRDYGEMSDAISACWRISGRPGKLSWKISLLCANSVVSESLWLTGFP
jgi:Heparinase II/III-like protein/Heparinase II/III N-terminus